MMPEMGPPETTIWDTRAATIRGSRICRVPGRHPPESATRRQALPTRTPRWLWSTASIVIWENFAFR